MAWDLLSLNDTVGPIFATEGNFYDVWNETESMGVVQVQEGIRNISTLLGSGITRKTNLDNIVEGYVKENQPEGVPQKLQSCPLHQRHQSTPAKEKALDHVSWRATKRPSDSVQPLGRP